MARPSGPKVRAGGRWTESRFNSFIRSALRNATRRWAPQDDVLKEARVGRGVYRCASCKQEVTKTYKDEDTGRRVKNVFIDHVEPVVDPKVGFVDWNTFIDRLFVEQDKLQLLCKACHDEKTAEERAQAAERKQNAD